MGTGYRVSILGAVVALILGALIVVAVRPEPAVIGFAGGLVGLVIPTLLGIVNMAKTDQLHHDLKNGLIPEKIREAIADPTVGLTTDTPTEKGQ